MYQFATLSLIFFATLSACEGLEDPTMRATFFDKYSATDLGTTKFILPALTPNINPPPAPPFVVNPGFRGAPVKMLNIHCEDRWAIPVTVSVRVEYDFDPNTGLPAVGGPLIGTLQWGVGGGENQVEFDIPSARIPDLMAPAGNFPNAPMVLNGNGVQIFLSGTSSVSLTVRNDGSMSPLTTPGVNTIGFVAGAKVIAFVSPGGNPRNTLNRTIVVSNILSPMVPMQAVQLTVPPFAKSVRFERWNVSGFIEPIRVQCLTFAGGNILRINNLGANDEGPLMLAPSTGQLEIINTGASDINQLNAVFDVTPT